MKRYKVKSLHIGGLGNKVFNRGDIVTERNFPAGNADKNVLSGHLEFHDEVENYVPVEKNNSKESTAKFEAAMKQAVDLATAGDHASAKEAVIEALNINPDSEEAKQMLEDLEPYLNHSTNDGGDDSKKADEIVDDGTVKASNDISEEELKAILTKRGISFNNNSKKKFLYNLYKESASK